MLYVNCLVHDVFQLVLVGIAEFLPDIIYKNSSLTQDFLQEDFKLSSGKVPQSFRLYPILVLLLSIQGSLFMKHDYKKNLIVVPRLGYVKIIVTLLYKIILIYMKLTLIIIQGLEFKSLFWGVFGDFLILITSYRELYFENCLENLLDIIFGILKNMGSSQTKSKVQQIGQIVETSQKNRKLCGFIISTWKTGFQSIKCGHRDLILTEALAFFCYRDGNA